MARPFVDDRPVRCCRVGECLRDFPMAGVSGAMGVNSCDFTFGLTSLVN